MFLRLPSSASLRTQSEATEDLDQRTMTQRASSIASSITWWNDLPTGIFRSHHTDQPWCSSTCASVRARSRSSPA